MMTSKIIRLCLLTALSAPLTVPAAAQGLAWLQTLASAQDGFRADFRCTISSPYWEEGQSFSGSLLMQGDRYRVDTGGEIIIAHGADTYVYRPVDNQVLITGQDPAFSPATLLGDFDEHYRVTDTERVVVGGTGYHLVHLAPLSQASTLVEVKLWMRADDGAVTRTVSMDVNETTMDIELTAIDLRPRIGPDTFALSFPQSVEFIDLRN